MASFLIYATKRIGGFVGAHLRTFALVLGGAVLAASSAAVVALNSDSPKQDTVKDSTNNSKTSVQLDSQTYSNNTEDPGNTGSSAINGQDQPEPTSNSEIKVNINGQDIPVPSSGTVQQQINDDNGQTNVQIDVNNQTTGDAKSTSNNANVRVRTDTHSTTRVTDKTNTKEVSR